MSKAVSRSQPSPSRTRPQKESVSTPPPRNRPLSVSSRTHHGARGPAQTGSQNDFMAPLIQSVTQYPWILGTTFKVSQESTLQRCTNAPRGFIPIFLPHSRFECLTAPRVDFRRFFLCKFILVRHFFLHVTIQRLLSNGGYKYSIFLC